MILIEIILLLLGAVIYLRKPRYVMLFWLSLTPFGILVFSWGLGIADRASLAELQFLITGLTRNLFALLVLIAICKHRQKADVRNLIIISFLVAFFFILHSCFTIFDIKIIKENISDITAIIFPLLFLMMDEGAVPRQKDLLMYVIWFMGIEIFAAVLNTKGIYLHRAFYTPALSAGLQNLYEYENSLVSGTFPRYNMLANYTVTVFLFFALESLSDKNFPRKWFYLGAIAFFSIILMSGARNSFVLYVFVLISTILVYNKGNKSLLIMMIFGGVFAINFVMQYNYYVDDSSMQFTGLFRQLRGASSFLHNSTEGGATVTISGHLLDYFFKSPLLGNGLAANGEYAYGYYANVGLTNFKADARIAFILAEYGIIGFLLYALLFRGIYDILKRNVYKSDFAKINIGFVFFFLMTTTEAGFFDRTCFPMMYLYVFAFLKKSNNENNI